MKLMPSVTFVTVGYTPGVNTPVMLGRLRWPPELASRVMLQVGPPPICNVSGAVKSLAHGSVSLPWRERVGCGCAWFDPMRLRERGIGCMQLSMCMVKAMESATSSKQAGTSPPPAKPHPMLSYLPCL